MLRAGSNPPPSRGVAHALHCRACGSDRRPQGGRPRARGTPHVRLGSSRKSESAHGTPCVGRTTRLELTRSQQARGQRRPRTCAPETVTVCPLRHPPHFNPSFTELNDIRQATTSCDKTGERFLLAHVPAAAALCPCTRTTLQEWALGLRRRRELATATHRRRSSDRSSISSGTS